MVNKIIFVFPQVHVKIQLKLKITYLTKVCLSVKSQGVDKRQSTLANSQYFATETYVKPESFEGCPLDKDV